MKKTFRIIGFMLVCALAAVLAPAAAWAASDEPDSVDEQAGTQAFRATELPLPRFVSLRSDKVYVRAGPALRYPIKWIYKRAGMPVEIVQEFDNWRKVRDFEGGEGWVHQSLLSGSRTVIVRATDPVQAAGEPVALHNAADAQSRIVARVEPQVVAALSKCASGGWCRIEAGGYRGWIQRNLLWGIYDDEEFN